MFKNHVNTLRHASLPGLNLAIVVLPQAIAFSFLAGVPPHFGIYCAIYGVLIVALISPSRHFHGGPNSSMSVAISVALLPYAPQFGPEYMGYVLSLGVMVGLVQVMFSLINPLSRLMDFMSEAVVSGIIFGIGLFLIFKSIPAFAGIPLNTQVEWPLIITWQTFLTAIEVGNPFAIEIGFVTLISAIIFRMIPLTSKWFLIFGLIVATIYSEYLNHTYGGLMITQLEQVGNLDLPLIMPSIPTFSPEALPDLLSLIPSAIAIALLGIFQTVAIVRHGRRMSGEYVSSKTATMADAIANITSGFISAIPGCGSFNRVALLNTFHTNGRYAAALSALFLFLLISAAKDWLAIIPLPAMAAMIMLVGANMLRLKDVKHHFKSPIETIVFISSFIAVHVFGLLNAALIGASFAFVNWVWHKSHPQLLVDGQHASITGDLYYASVAVIEKPIIEMVKKYGEARLDLSHMSHIDAEATRWIAKIGDAHDCRLFYTLNKKQERTLWFLRHIGNVNEHRLLISKNRRKSDRRDNEVQSP